MRSDTIRAEHAARLHKAPLFSAYSDSEFEGLLALCHYQRIAAETTLFKAQEACSAIYFMLSGFIELYREGLNGSRKIIEFIDGEQTFAEAALFSGQGYPVSARSLLDSELIRIDSVRFSLFLQQHPQLNWRMLGSLSIRLHHLVEQITSLSLHNAEQKVASFLLENYDDENQDGIVSHLPGRRRDLAARLSLSEETLCRVLGRFRKEGWVQTKDSSRVYLHHPEALQNLLDKA